MIVIPQKVTALSASSCHCLYIIHLFLYVSFSVLTLLWHEEELPETDGVLGTRVGLWMARVDRLIIGLSDVL